MEDSAEIQSQSVLANEQASATNNVSDVISKILGEEVAKKFEAEGISEETMLQDLCLREADAPIFTRLGLNYGQAIKFQKECQSLLPNIHGHILPTIKYKPTMAQISMFSPEQKKKYLVRRRRVGVNATQFWKGEYPKFNTPKRKAELSKFADENLVECAMPEVGFEKEAIMEHVKAYFNEQRRTTKRSCSSSGENTSCSDSEALSQQDKHSLTKSYKQTAMDGACYTSNGTNEHINKDSTKLLLKPVGKADTDSTHQSDTQSSSDTEDEESSYPLFDSSGQMSVELEFNVKTCLLILTKVCNRPVDRKDCIKILKSSRFQMDKAELNQLTTSELMEMLCRKLRSQSYFSIAPGVQEKDLTLKDILVKREIAGL